MSYFPLTASRASTGSLARRSSSSSARLTSRRRSSEQSHLVQSPPQVRPILTSTSTGTGSRSGASASTIAPFTQATTVSD
jgi:hypothetical protein